MSVPAQRHPTKTGHRLLSTVPVTIEATGPFAMFCRPEFKAERISYPIITPSAAVGLLKAVYWKPGIDYAIDEIAATVEPGWLNVTRNEVKVTSLQANGSARPIDIETARTQRGARMLTDVGYRITFRVIIDTEAFVGESPAMLLAKHHGIALRRLRKGQHFSQPFLGTRECSANVVLIEDLDAATPLVRSWTCEIGSMFLGWDFSQVRTRHTLAADEGKLTASGGPVGRWGAARIVDGVLRIEEFEPSAALDIAFGLVYELDLNMDLDREAVS